MIGRHRLSRRGRPLKIDQYVAAFDLDRIDLEVLGRRAAQRLAGADFELRLMQRAFDRVALDEPVGEQSVGVGADAVGRVDLIADAEQRDIGPVDLDSHHAAVAQRIERRHLLPRHGIAPFVGWVERLRDPTRFCVCWVS